MHGRRQRHDGFRTRRMWRVDNRIISSQSLLNLFPGEMGSKKRKARKGEAGLQVEKSSGSSRKGRRRSGRISSYHDLFQLTKPRASEAFFITQIYSLIRANKRIDFNCYELIILQSV